MASFCYSLRCFCSGVLCCQVLRLLTYPTFQGHLACCDSYLLGQGDGPDPPQFFSFLPGATTSCAHDSRISASRTSSSEGCKNHEQVNGTAAPLQVLWALNLSFMLGCRDCKIAPASSLTSAAKPVSPSVSPEHQFTSHRAALIFTMSHNSLGQPFWPCTSRSSVC